MAFSLEGQPAEVGIDNSAVSGGSQTMQLLIGATAFLFAIGLIIYTATRSQQEAVKVSFQGEEQSAFAERRERLISTIAALDDAYEAGEIEEEQYRVRREALREELIAIWEVN